MSSIFFLIVDSSADKLERTVKHHTKATSLITPKFQAVLPFTTDVLGLGSSSRFTITIQLLEDVLLLHL